MNEIIIAADVAWLYLHTFFSHFKNPHNKLPFSVLVTVHDNIANAVAKRHRAMYNTRESRIKPVRVLSGVHFFLA